MITDKDTNTIYFSELLNTDKRFTNTFEELSTILDSFGIKPRLLSKTKDIWARDYMPVQVSEEKFVEFRYDSDYLQGTKKGYRDIKTYPDIVCDAINLKTTKSEIILDGGNVIKSNNCVILTDKVVIENRLQFSKEDLTKRLKGLFEVGKIVLIPWDRKEIFGHADGMLRFIDDKTVLINEIYESDTVLNYRLKQCGLEREYLRLIRNENEEINWSYINFLQTKDLILLPKFDVEEDKSAYKQIKQYYPEYGSNNRIAQVNMKDVVKNGGALNCVSWTIKE